MKDIRITLLHPINFSLDDIYIILGLSKDKYNLIIDNEQPDYVIASEHIYYQREMMEKFIKLQNDSVVNIFYAGECISPDLNLFDYAIVFDRELRLLDRIGRIPTLDFFHKRITDKLNKKVESPQEILASKTGFCNFIYTNGNAHPMRDKLFHKICEYKKVDALGTHLRNVDLDVIFVDEAIRSNYKFTIASENACYRGYTSEKLFQALQANTIPIYWGDPLVTEGFNEKAFINANNLTLDEVLEKIKELDNDDEKYCQMVSEPHMTQEQYQKYLEESAEYKKFTNNIFAQDLAKAKRVPQGTHPNNYRNFFANLYNEIPKEIIATPIIEQRPPKKKKVIRIFGIKISFVQK